jgi:hypothetical protein
MKQETSLNRGGVASAHLTAGGSTHCAPYLPETVKVRAFSRRICHSLPILYLARWGGKIDGRLTFMLFWLCANSPSWRAAQEAKDSRRVCVKLASAMQAIKSFACNNLG